MTCEILQTVDFGKHNMNGVIVQNGYLKVSDRLWGKLRMKLTFKKKFHISTKKSPDYNEFLKFWNFWNFSSISVEGKRLMRAERKD